jgi:hydrogenase expression/formation protein HypC
MCLAVPGELLGLKGDDPLSRIGRVSFSGVLRDVSMAYVPEAAVGDYVLVHAGFAISVVDPGEARQSFEYLAQIGALEEKT